MHYPWALRFQQNLVKATPTQWQLDKVKAVIDTLYMHIKAFRMEVSCTIVQAANAPAVSSADLMRIFSRIETRLSGERPRINGDGLDIHVRDMDYGGGRLMDNQWPGIPAAGSGGATTNLVFMLHITHEANGLGDAFTYLQPVAATTTGIIAVTIGDPTVLWNAGITFSAAPVANMFLELEGLPFIQFGVDARFKNKQIPQLGGGQSVQLENGDYSRLMIEGSGFGYPDNVQGKLVTMDGGTYVPTRFPNENGNQMFARFAREHRLGTGVETIAQLGSVFPYTPLISPRLNGRVDGNILRYGQNWDLLPTLGTPTAESLRFSMEQILPVDVSLREEALQNLGIMASSVSIVDKKSNGKQALDPARQHFAPHKVLMVKNHPNTVPAHKGR